ncbi:MAG: purine-nucleoside phosphorylase [Actinomycetota bacterium]|nr:purine-nucleoside phosphorylase [Actinomycetota bacterium]
MRAGEGADLPSPPGEDLAAKALAVIRERTSLRPVAGVILGSGLGAAVQGVEEEAAFPYPALPGFAATTVPGHAGRLVLGRLAGTPVAVFLGRMHYYEGNPMARSALPVQVSRLLGADTMVLTASVGALDASFAPGTVVVGSDHINLMGENPLRGWRRPDGSPPFVDLSAVYDPWLAAVAVEEAQSIGAPVGRGVYLAVSGPSYETPAEIEFMRRAGGSVVGMSVVPEAVPARALGMRVLGLFSVTNAVGGEVSHQEVIRVGTQMGSVIGRLLAGVLPRLAGTGAIDEG